MLVLLFLRASFPCTYPHLSETPSWTANRFPGTGVEDTGKINAAVAKKERSLTVSHYTNTHEMTTRKKEKYKVQFANTGRLQQSPLIYIQKLLNEEESKQQK